MMDYSVKSLIMFLLLIPTLFVNAQGGGAELPTTQSHSIVFSNIGATKMNVGWTIGNGTNRVVFIRESDSASASPSNDTTYMANDKFKQGAQIGSTGWYCVYNGPGASATVTGLMPDTTYRIMVCEYNGTPGNENYLTITASGNPVNQTMNGIIINEVDADTPGSDTAEFIELYDGGIGNVSLDGLVIVFYNGSNDNSYSAHDLDSLTTDDNGYFILGNAAVAGVDKIFSNGGLQNGADAVALFADDASDFPSGTALTTTNLVDALVYDTGDADDAGLLVLISSGGQIDEKGKGDSDSHSNQRIPNGSGGQRNTSSYDQMPPTPGETNNSYPTIASATYDVSTGNLVITGTKLVAKAGANNDIDASKFTFTGEAGGIYTLTDTPDKEITSATEFTLNLSATDKTAVNILLNKEGTQSNDNTIYNIAADEDWAAGADPAVKVADVTGNGITVSSVPAPTITSSTYDSRGGILEVTGTNLVKKTGTNNDIDASKFTITGEAGGTYTLTNTPDVDITSGTKFTLTLSAVDKNAVGLLLNKEGTASEDNTTYNIAAAEDWAVGADPAVNVVDAAGNGITALNFNIPPTSADGSITINEDSQHTFKESDFPFNDTNGDTFAGIEIVSVETDGDLEYNSADVADNTAYTDVTKLVFIPDVNENGTPYATFTFKAKDSSGNLSVNSYTITINVNSVNDAPVLSNIETVPLIFTENSSPVAVSDKIKVKDEDDINMYGASVSITANYQSGEDLLSFEPDGYSGISGSWDETSGTLTLTGIGSRITYQNNLKRVAYQNTNTDNPCALTRTLTFQVSDESSHSNTVSRDISVSTLNDLPVLSGIENSSLIYTENDPSTQITNTIKITDVDDSTLQSASVQITDNYQFGEDLLIFTETDNITGAFNPVDGKLSLAGTDTKAGYQTALRNVTYYNTDPDTPIELTRVVSFIVEDGIGESNLLTRNIDVLAVNDPPEIDTSGVDTTPHVEGNDSLKILLSIKDENVESLKYSAECSSDSIRAEIIFNSPASLLIVPLLNADISATILVIVSDGFSADTLTFYVEITEKNYSPAIAGINNYTINEGEQFDKISLDDFVNDENDKDNELVWTVKRNTDLTFDINDSRFLSIVTPGPEWSGKETITLKVEDPDGLADSVNISFTVLAVNDPPVFVADGIPDIQFNEDTEITIGLSQYVSDLDNDDAEIEFDAALVNVISTKPQLPGNLEAANDDLIINLDNENKTVTFSALKDSTGKYSVVITASDSFDETKDTIEVTVLPVNDAPVLSGLPDIKFPEDSLTTLALSPFVFDVDNNSLEISWIISFPGNLLSNLNKNVGSNLRFASNEAMVVKTNSKKKSLSKALPERSSSISLLVNDADSLIVEIDEETNTLSVSAAKNFNGIEIPLILEAFDGEVYSNPDTLLITVIAVNDPPVIAELPGLSFNEDDTLSVAFDTWQSYISDPETPNDELMYFFTKGHEISFELIGPVTGYNLFAGENWFGDDTLTFSVSDEDTTVSRNFFVNVLSINDLPEFAGLPDTIFGAGDTTFFNLWEYTDDIETIDENFNYEFSGYDEGILGLDYNRNNGNISLSVIPGFNDAVSFNLTVIDEGGGEAKAEMIFKPRITTGLGELALQIPDNYLIEQNYPNPFNPSTTIWFGLPSESNVNIAIYNLLGELVNVLVDQVKPAGYYEYHWNASGLASGVYIYSVYAEATDRSAKFSQVKKMLLLK